MAKDLDIDIDGESVPELVFDYAALDPDTARMCRTAAERVRKTHALQIQAILETGRLLTEVKDLLSHGTFLDWIRSECLFSQRTAQNYMSVFRNVGGEYETISHLRPKTIYRIAAPSTPQEARRDIIAEGRRLTDEEALEVIKSARNGEKFEMLGIQGRKRRPIKAADLKADPRVREAARAMSADRVHMSKIRSSAKLLAASMIAELAGEHRSRLVEILRKAGYDELASDVNLVLLETSETS